MIRYYLICAFLLMGINSKAQLTKTIGSNDFSDWKGIEKVKKNVATINSGEVISYRYPDGKKRSKGFRVIYGNASDWSAYAGLSFEIYLKAASSATLNVSMKVAEEDAGSLNPVSSVALAITGKGWQSVYVPWNMFDLSEVQRIGTLQAIKELNILANSLDNRTLQIRNVAVKKGKTTTGSSGSYRCCLYM